MSVCGLSYLQDMLAWCNSLDDTSRADFQPGASRRRSCYTTDRLPLIIVGKFFQMVKSVRLYEGKKQKENINNNIIENVRACHTNTCPWSATRSHACKPRVVNQSMHYISLHAGFNVVNKSPGNRGRRFPEFFQGAGYCEVIFTLVICSYATKTQGNKKISRSFSIRIRIAQIKAKKWLFLLERRKEIHAQILSKWKAASVRDICSRGVHISGKKVFSQLSLLTANVFDKSCRHKADLEVHCLYSKHLRLNANDSPLKESSYAVVKGIGSQTIRQAPRN